jgi:hypothetical protein
LPGLKAQAKEVPAALKLADVAHAELLVSHGAGSHRFAVAQFSPGHRDSSRIHFGDGFAGGTRMSGNGL